MACTLLMRCKNVMYTYFVQIKRIIERDNLSARISEDCINTLMHKAFNDYFCTGH